MRKRSSKTEGPQSDSPAGSETPAEPTSVVPFKPKNKAAAELGRRGGMKGGAARAAKMSKEELSASSRAAARARWAKAPTALLAPPELETLEGEVMPPSPFAKHRGIMDLGGTPVDVYVLDTDDRVVSMRGAVKALTGQDAGNLVEYLSIQGLKDFIDKDLVLVESREFFIPGTQFKGRGITAEQLEAIITAYVRALGAGALNTDRQREIATKCAILSTAFLRSGIVALIDEATGYQYERAADALEVKFKAYVADELRDWEKTFPDELWEQFGRLTGWKGPLHKRPKWWGHLVNELIYDAMDADIARYLRENKPKPFHGQNYHQWLTEDIGLKALIPHIYKIIGMAEACRTMPELKHRVAAKYGRQRMQFSLYLPFPQK